jgi:hypothetical protein
LLVRRQRHPRRHRGIGGCGWRREEAARSPFAATVAVTMAVQGEFMGVDSDLI